MAGINGCEKCRLVDKNIIESIKRGGDVGRNLRENGFGFSWVTAFLAGVLDRVDDPTCYPCVYGMVKAVGQFAPSELTAKQTRRKEGEKRSHVREQGKHKSKRTTTVNNLPGRTLGVKTGSGK